MPSTKLLVLDLDETLIHASDRPLAIDPDFYVGPYAIHRRPGVDDFLSACLERFERVGVWTASSLAYALPVLSQLGDPRRLAFVWGRERCTYRIDQETREGEWLKDIRKLRRCGFEKRSIIVVDDTPAKLARSYGNLVAVRPFEGDPSDDELPALEPYLSWLADVEDVRAIEKRRWRQRRLPGNDGKGPK
jgi:TFIIF-interacting CTD phosphatase-like protein